jgi:hypothetical protein
MYNLNIILSAVTVSAINPPFHPFWGGGVKISYVGRRGTVYTGTDFSEKGGIIATAEESVTGGSENSQEILVMLFNDKCKNDY